jgi:hypothetical protein
MKRGNTHVIDLTKVRKILTEVEKLVEDLDGLDLDERTAVESQSGSVARKERAHQSQSLNLLSDRLVLAASLVRVEYWHARGRTDPLVDTQRSD